MAKKSEEFSIKLTAPSTVAISGKLEIDDPAIYAAFKKAKVDGKSEREFFEEALRLGVYGLMEARIAAFLGRAKHELDGGLEQLKFIFALKEEEQQGTAKGDVMEREIRNVLEEFVGRNKWKDEITDSGAAIGSVTARKVGDVDVKVEGTDVRLTIESKFDKTVQLGDIVNLDKRGNKDPVGDAESTAHGQLLLSLANRQSQVALIVFDRNECHSDIRALEQDVVFYPELPGFVVRIGKETADFAPLRLAYSIARQLALLGADKVSAEHLNIATKRMLRDLNEFKKIELNLKKIKAGAESAIEGVGAIELVVSRVRTSVLRTQGILEKVLSGSVPSAEDWRVFAAEPGGIADA
jgi:hypothetical protein